MHQVSSFFSSYRDKLENMKPKIILIVLHFFFLPMDMGLWASVEVHH